MKIAVFNNKRTDFSKRCADKVKKELKASGAEFYESDGLSFQAGTDVVVVVGGDGSILKIADLSAYGNIPILGINTGRIGFLTETERPDEIVEAVRKLLNNEYSIDRRTMLEVKSGNDAFFALNEVAVSRADNLNIVGITLKTNGEILEKYNGDGVLIATPTGSTAYSLSAGGPVLSPHVKAILVTPICPHTLHSRSIVVPDDTVIEVSAALRGEGVVVVDGKKKVVFNNEGSFTIKKSAKKCSFVRFDGQSFYSKLLSKLTQWSDISFD
jgi:NAD+ kinase